MITKKELYNLYVIKNLSSTEISKLKQIGRTTILNYLTKYNIPKRNSGAQIKYQANHEFFNNWSQDMAYCLGFIASDGHVWKDRPFVTIGIHKNDIAILNFIRDCISPSSPVRISKNKCQICVFSPSIHKTLCSLGVDHNKTLNLKLPKKIPQKYISHFIRGFFDGDGSIWKTKFTKKGADYYYANIASASRRILEDINNFLGFGTLRTVRNKYYELKFCQSDCLKLYDIIYKDANFKLERKYNKFLLINSSYKFWTSDEDQIIYNNINSRDTKCLIPLLPLRNYKAIQARKNYLRKKCNASTKNSKN